MRAWVLTGCVCWAGLAASAFGQHRGAADGPLLTQVTQAGGRAMALGEFCTALNRSQVRNFAVALAEWQQRNRWTVVKGYWASRPELQTAYTEAETAANRSFAEHRLKTSIACGLMGGVLRQAEWDPSVQHRGEIAALPEVAQGSAGAGVPNAAAAGAAADGTGGGAASSGGGASGAASTSAGTAPTTGAAGGSTAVSSAAAADGSGRMTAGVASFSVPAGWTVVNSSAELVMLARQEERNRGRTLMVVTAVPLQGELRPTAFRAFQSQFPGTGLEFKYFQDGTTGQGLPAVYGGDTGKLRTGGSGTIRAVAVKVGSQVETVMMLLPATALVQIPRQNEMEAMVAGMSYQGAGGGTGWSVERVPAGYGGLSGLWMGSRMQSQLNPLGGMDLLAVRDYAVLLPDGRAYFALPTGGRVLDMDYGAACLARPKDCGLYKVSGGQIELEHRGDYGMVTRRTVALHRDGGGQTSFTDGGATMAEMHPVHAQRLSGRYTTTSGSSGSMGGQSTSVYTQTFLSFTPDGRFEKSGFTTASFSGAAAAGTANSHRGVESGQYTIDGYTLLLQPANVAAERYTIVFETVSESPKAVFVDDRAFLR